MKYLIFFLIGLVIVVLLQMRKNKKNSFNELDAGAEVDQESDGKKNSVNMVNEKADSARAEILRQLSRIATSSDVGYELENLMREASELNDIALLQEIENKGKKLAGSNYKSNIVVWKCSALYLGKKKEAHSLFISTKLDDPEEFDDVFIEACELLRICDCPNEEIENLKRDAEAMFTQDGVFQSNWRDSGWIDFVPEKSTANEEISSDDEVDRSVLVGLISIKKARDNSAMFDSLMQDIEFDGFDVLGIYFKEDPRFDPEGYTGLTGAWATCLSTNREEKSQKIIKVLQSFQHDPDIYTLWKYALLNQYAATDLEVLPTVNFSSPISLLEAIGGNVDQCLELMREASNHFQSKEISEQHYQDAMKSLVLCYLAAAFNEDDAFARIRQLIHLIGNNEPIDGVSFEGTTWGEGEHMQGCRRVVEEFSEIRLEVPDGIDVDTDGYLDLVNWDEVAERVYSHLV
jgi:hypothetical protein